MDPTKQNKGTRRKQQQPLDLSTLVYGKVPPQSREIEEAVLGAIMLEKNAFDEASDILKSPEVFYVDAHKRIYKAMVALSAKGQPIDMLTVVEELKLQENLDFVGGPYYVTKLTNAVVSSANIESHCRIIIQKFIQRDMIRICGETITEAYEESSDAFNVVDEHEKKLTEITITRQSTERIVPIDKALVDTYQRIELRRANDEHVTGISSGFPSLDKITHGWQNTDLIILAARPSVGKTAFALNLARNAALHPKKPTAVALFSLEMSMGQLTERLISSESEIWLEKIATGQLENFEMEQLYRKGIQKLAKAKIIIDDTPALNVFELRARSRRLKRLDNIGLIIIDYLQLMSSVEKGNREQEVSNISRSLKALAKELEVPIIALSQLSREPEKRKNEGYMPKLSDLRESGAIEQDADVVVFIYRPEYHDINANEMGETNRGETLFRIAKHRNGKLETVKLKARLEIQKFFEPSEDVSTSMPFLPPGGNWRPVSSLPYKDDDIAF